MSKNFERFTFLFCENYRSRAYAQYMLQANILPDKIICIGNENLFSPNPLQEIYQDPYSDFSFRPEQQVCDTFQDIRHINTELSHLDINSKSFREAVSKLDINRAVYSGRSGVLIASSTLKQFKEILHVHGGYLPDFRGSTTFYFSILSESAIGASAIILNSKIDHGNILYRQKFKPMSGINVDYVLDPIVRANVLVSTLNKLLTQKIEDIVLKQNTNSGSTYQVIHPLLKWKALKKIEST